MLRQEDHKVEANLEYSGTLNLKMNLKMNKQSQK